MGFVPWMNVKIMGSKTVNATPKASAEELANRWDGAYEHELSTFAGYYKKLVTAYPGVRFNFFTDGDPPDKEDAWKMFTAYCAAQPGNKLTIVRADNNKNDAKKRIDAWIAKGALDVSMKLSGIVTVREYTTTLCNVVLALNIVPRSTVFDTNCACESGSMLDGDNFKEFRIVNKQWTVPGTNSARPILEPDTLPNTGVLSRNEMEEFLLEQKVEKVVVKSQAQLELERDYVGWGVVVIDDAFKVLLKPMAPWAAVPEQ